jgi:hypothetical protein
VNAYQLGLTTGPVDVRMPGAIKDEILSIGTAFKTLDREIQARKAKLSPQWLAAWQDFRAGWERFAADHASWLSNAWYASYQKAIEFRQRLDGWRAQLETITGPLNLPTLSPRPLDVAPSSGIPWKTVLYVGLGIGGVIAVSRLLSNATEAKREIIGARGAA